MKILCVVVLVIAVEALRKEDVPGQFVFAANLYKELVKEASGGSFLVSPLSAQIILALVGAGAKSKTAQQLFEGLSLPEDHNKVQKIFEKLIPTLKKYNVSTANKIYIKRKYKVSKKFKQIATEVYGAEVENINFYPTWLAANKINNWVQNKTDNKIKKLITKRDLYRSLRLILINALHFHGEWAVPFRPELTEEGIFKVNKTYSTNVTMMTEFGFLKFSKSSKLDAKILELPYYDLDVTMTIVLPNDKNGLAKLENKLVDVLLPDKRPTEYTGVAVTLPKFQTETTIQLKPILQALGVSDAFENSADFSGIGPHGKRLKIGKVVQKSFIEINENGTTAAAATAVINKFHLPRGVPEHFQADHPFLYYLRTSNNTIFFVGRYTGPQE